MPMAGAEQRTERRIAVSELPEEYRQFGALLRLTTEVAVTTTDVSLNGFGFVAELPSENFIVGSRLVLYPLGKNIPVFGVVVHSAAISTGTRVGVRLQHLGGYDAYTAVISKLLGQVTEPSTALG